MLSDPEKKVAEAYGVLPPVNPDRPDAPRYARRWMFFIGPDGKILHIEKVGHTADAGEYLAKTLAELGREEEIVRGQILGDRGSEAGCCIAPGLSPHSTQSALIR